MDPAFGLRARRPPERASFPEPKIRRQQHKLQVGAANDPAEAHADRMADEVMTMLGQPTRVQAEPSATRIQRRVAPAADSTAVRQQPESAVVGPQGGPVDQTTTDIIDGAQSQGVGLNGQIRRSMEAAFGADLSAVRIHDDARSHAANTRIMARAFTTGNDIFFGRDSYKPAAAGGQRLIAHELAHVVQQGGQGTAHRAIRTTGPGLIQRDLQYGNDPQASIKKTDKDLLYGLATPRAATMNRLTGDQKKTIRTIDEYNHAIGINAVMGSAMGIYDVRAELNSANAWGLPLDAALNTETNAAAIQQWIVLLRGHAAHIGLEDLGTKGGTFSKNKIDKKSRFKKNRKESQASEPKNDQLTPADTRRFLSPGHTKATAQLEYDNMSDSKQRALNSWMSNAFFRRTSKLGQTFAITTLGARIHMNTTADPNYDPMNEPQWQQDGLNTQSSGKNDKNRSITVSELRHLKKITKNQPAAANVYGEAPNRR